MGPLVYYCRWQRARLRMAGKGNGIAWGELAYADGSRERFRYELADRRLVLGEGEDERTLLLDERGVVLTG